MHRTSTPPELAAAPGATAEQRGHLKIAQMVKMAKLVKIVYHLATGAIREGEAQQPAARAYKYSSQACKQCAQKGRGSEREKERERERERRMFRHPFLHTDTNVQRPQLKKR